MRNLLFKLFFWARQKRLAAQLAASFAAIADSARALGDGVIRAGQDLEAGKRLK